MALGHLEITAIFRSQCYANIGDLDGQFVVKIIVLTLVHEFTNDSFLLIGAQWINSALLTHFQKLPPEQWIFIDFLFVLNGELFQMTFEI